MESSKLEIWCVTSGVRLSSVPHSQYAAAFSAEKAIAVVRTQLSEALVDHRKRVAEDEQHAFRLRAQGKEEEAIAFLGDPVVRMRASISPFWPGEPDDWKAHRVTIPGFVITVQPL